MTDRVPEFKIKLSAGIAAVLFLFGLTGYQYFYVYSPEKQRLQIAVIEIQKQLYEVKRIQRYLERLNEAEKHIKALSQLLPEKLEPEIYFEEISRLAKALKIDINQVDKQVSNKTFYNQAQFTVMLKGSSEAVNRFIEKIESGRRLTHITVLSEGQTGARVNLSVFSVPREDFGEIKIETGRCSTFKSKVWLWPFSIRILKLNRELKTLCEKKQGHLEDVKRVKIIKMKLAETHKLLEILKHIRGNEVTKKTNRDTGRKAIQFINDINFC